MLPTMSLSISPRIVIQHAAALQCPRAEPELHPLLCVDTVNEWADEPSLKKSEMLLGLRKRWPPFNRKELILRRKGSCDPWLEITDGHGLRGSTGRVRPTRRLNLYQAIRDPLGSTPKIVHGTAHPNIFQHGTRYESESCRFRRGCGFR